MLKAFRSCNNRNNYLAKA